MVYAPSIIVALRISVQLLLMKSTVIDMARNSNVVLLTTCCITGRSFSPSSTASSVTPLRAFSRPAWTVLFCTSNSFVTEAASLYAFAASPCCHFTVSMLAARAAITCEALAPFSPISLNTGASTSILPSSCNRSISIISPSLVLRFRASLNLSAFMPVALTILSCSLNRFMISLERAVADISTA